MSAAVICSQQQITQGGGMVQSSVNWQERESFNSDLACEGFNVFVSQELKRGSAGSPLENKQMHRASQGPFSLFCTPGAPSHTVNQEACVTDGLFSSHKHGTPLETAQPLSTVLYLQHTDKAPQMLPLNTSAHDRFRPTPCVLKLNWRGRKMTLHNV